MKLSHFGQVGDGFDGKESVDLSLFEVTFDGHEERTRPLCEDVFGSSLEEVFQLAIERLEEEIYQKCEEWVRDNSSEESFAEKGDFLMVHPEQVCASHVKGTLKFILEGRVSGTYAYSSAGTDQTGEPTHANRSFEWTSAFEAVADGSGWIGETPSDWEIESLTFELE